MLAIGLTSQGQSGTAKGRVDALQQQPLVFQPEWMSAACIGCSCLSRVENFKRVGF